MNKKWAFAGAFVAAVIAGSTFYAHAAKGQTRLVSGEVISLCNYLVNDQTGEEGRDAGQFLVGQRQLPVAILDAETDELYIAIWKGSKSANEKLAPHIGTKVNAQGKTYKKHGVNLIEISVVAEAL